MTRIIGGSARGRRLRTPKGESTRPTADRVREALFSTLEARLGSLSGLRLLDLYAGSGAVALEALSRGAAAATAVESDRRAAGVITDNAATVGVPLDVVARPVAATLATSPSAPYDVVFLDPPYPLPEDELAVALGRLVEHGWLTADAVVIVERSARGPEPSWPEGLVPERSKDYGETVLWYVRADSTGIDDHNELIDGRERRVRKAVCPGSFDPVTNGHIDIISRASALFDEVVVAVGINKSKSRARLFTAEERIAMLEEVSAGFGNVTVAGFEGLLTDFCTEHGIHAIVKGLRAVSDFDYELQMAQMNSSLTGVETVFIPCSPEYSFLASSLVKEVATFGGDVSSLLPPDVLGALTRRLAERAEEQDG